MRGKTEDPSAHLASEVKPQREALTLIRARNQMLVRLRTAAVNTVRGLAKP